MRIEFVLDLSPLSPVFLDRMYEANRVAPITTFSPLQKDPEQGFEDGLEMAWILKVSTWVTSG